MNIIFYRPNWGHNRHVFPPSGGTKPTVAPPILPIFTIFSPPEKNYFAHMRNSAILARKHAVLATLRLSSLPARAALRGYLVTTCKEWPKAIGSLPRSRSGGSRSLAGFPGHYEPASPMALGRPADRVARRFAIAQFALPTRVSATQSPPLHGVNRYFHKKSKYRNSH